MPLHGFTAVDLGYQQGNAVSNIVNKIDEPPFTATYLSLFDQIWNDPEKLEDVTDAALRPHRLRLSGELARAHLLPDALQHLQRVPRRHQRGRTAQRPTGYQDSLDLAQAFNFQRDAATGIINKLETYNGCILADSVGLGKTFTALAVIKYYELRNQSVLVLCPKKLADNWLNYNRNLKTNIFAKDRFNYDVLCHTDLLAHQRRVVRHAAEPGQLGQLRPGRHRRVAQLPQQRRLQGPGDPLPEADEQGHPRRA